MAGVPKVKRSGGPKTEAGKLAASANSLKTGAYSVMVVLPGESEEDFRQLEEQFVRDFSPQDVAERALLHDLAVLTWKKLRLDRLEQAAFVRSLNKPLKSYELSAEGVMLDNIYDWIIADLSILTPEFIEANQAQVDFLKKFEDHTISKEEFFALPKTQPELFDVIVEMVRERYQIDEPNPLPEQMIRLSIDSGVRGTEAFVHHAFRKLLETSRQIAYVASHLDQIQQAVANIKERRLLELMQQPNLARASDELHRAFARTLAELRRQQQWRFKMRAVEVSAVPDSE